MARPRVTYSLVARDPDTGELGVAVQSHWFSVGSVVTHVRARRRRRRHAVGARPGARAADPRPARRRRRARRGDRRGARRRRGAPRTARPAVVDAQGRVAAHTGDGLHGRRRPHDRRRAGRAQANMMVTRRGVAGDGRGVRRRRRPARRAAARRRSTPPRRRAATCAAASRRRCSSSPARRAVAPHGRPARRGPPRPAGRAAPPARPAPRLRRGGGGRRADGRGPARRGAASCTSSAGRAGAREAPSCSFWSGLAAVAARRRRRGRRARARARSPRARASASCSTASARTSRRPRARCATRSELATTDPCVESAARHGCGDRCARSSSRSLIAGDANLAEIIALDAVAEGMPVVDLYVDVVGPALEPRSATSWETGRMIDRRRAPRDRHRLRRHAARQPRPRRATRAARASACCSPRSAARAT